MKLMGNSDDAVLLSVVVVVVEAFAFAFPAFLPLAVVAVFLAVASSTDVVLVPLASCAATVPATDCGKSVGRCQNLVANHKTQFCA